MAPRFSVLVDENIERSIDRALRRLSPEVVVYRVGRTGCPSIGDSDPVLLAFAESVGAAVVTRDLSTFPGHVAAHLAAGGHTWGVLVLRSAATTSAVIDDLLAVASASEQAEWRDTIQ